MTSPRAPIDTREYTVESARFPTRDATGDPIEVREPTVRPGRLEVVIDGVDEELETLTATPPGTGPFPLALISHGIPAKDLVARNKRLRSFLPLAESFARRGYYAVVFARRGFGSSTGTVVGRPRLWCGHWPSGAYARAARALADEYAVVMAALVRRPEVDGTEVVAVGESVGGLTVLALASQRPPGLIAAINFAGGHGGNGRHGVCNASALRRAFADFGRKARIPSLWLYSTADSYFWPSLARGNFDAFTAGGAPARLQMVGPLGFTRDGHDLFTLAGRELWQPRISAFLRDIDAPGWQLDPATAIVPKLPSPEGLGEEGERAWLRYLGGAGHRAFAIGDGGGWGWAAERSNRKEAEDSAIAFCQQYTVRCRVVAADAEVMHSDNRTSTRSER